LTYEDTIHPPITSVCKSIIGLSHPFLLPNHFSAFCVNRERVISSEGSPVVLQKEKDGGMVAAVLQTDSCAFITNSNQEE